MTIAHVGTTSATVENSSPLTISLHASAAAGQLAILRLHYEGRAVSINSPSGWTLLRNQSYTNGTSYYGPITWYRILTAGDISTGSVSISGSYNSSFNFAMAAAISVYSGADTSNPIDAEAGGSYLTGTNPFTVGPITTITDNAMLVASIVGQLGSSVSASSVTPPGTMTEILDLNTGLPTAARIFALYRHLTTTAGSQGSYSFTLDTLTGGSSVPALLWHLVAIRPALPTITSISPASGAAAGGTTVTIKGTLLTGTSAVTFGGSSATDVTVIDDNNVTCVVPSHAAGAVDVVLTATAGSVTSTGGFTYGAPTITALSLAKSPLAGGVSTTITGTNFASGATVTIDGVACTSVVVVSSTVITCVVPAGTAGAKDVVVTSGDSATLAGGFTYVDAYDNLVKLVKAGSVAGNSKASATHWGVTDEWVSYGGAQDLWGTTLSPSDVNNASFGAAVSAVAGSGATAKVTAMRITVYYTVPGISDAASYVVALQVDPTKTIAKPYVYKLPRADLTVANDPNISLARADAQFYTSRYPQPSRNVQKTYREVEFWLDASPQTSTPGLQVWAALDEAAAYQLNDNTGAAGTFRTTGPQRAFFPASASAVGHYCQLVFKVPAKAQGEVDVAVSLRDIVIRGALDPITTDLITATFVLGGGEFEDKTSQRKSAKAQLAALKALADPTAAPVAYRDPWGGTGYLKVARVDTKEATYKGATQSVMLANVTMRVMEYA